LIQESPLLADNEASLHKHVAHFANHDKVDVALAVSDLDVFQAVPLLRQRQKTFREENQLVCHHRQFARARAEQGSFNANEVTDIEQLVQLKITVGKLVFFRVNLQLAFSIR